MQPLPCDSLPTCLSRPLPPLHPSVGAEVQARWDAKTKPLGSLGELEALAVQVAQIQNRTDPRLCRAEVIVFAGDHGAACAGVSAYPQEVTWQMVANFLCGGAAISVLAKAQGCALTIVDAGVNHAFAATAGLVDRKIAHGTANYLHQPAMTRAQCLQALKAGEAMAVDSAADTLLLGDMGIGNSASASLILHHLSGHPLAQCVGPGTGLDAQGVARKLGLLAQATRHHALPVTDADPLQVLATFGGFEVAMLVGCILGAAQTRKVVVVDGFIVSAAALVAERLQPGLSAHLVFAHLSAEPAHQHLLSLLTQARPLLQLGLRLGEGSAAALAWPVLRLSLALLSDMATFQSAQVSPAQAVAAS
ncbi:MAG: nicotinate-nucleotide--dimethylbenzimidazole phosphoribosyltransferase [Pseudomonadota bacterium]